MREFILSFIVVILLSIIVELFGPTKKMNKAVMSALSLVVILLIVTNFKKVITRKIDDYDLNAEVYYSAEKLSGSSANYIEGQIKLLLKSNGIENVKEVEVKSEITSLKINYTKVIITINDNYDKDKIVKLVKEILPTINDEEVVFK